MLRSNDTKYLIKKCNFSISGKFTGTPFRMYAGYQVVVWVNVYFILSYESQRRLHLEIIPDTKFNVG